MAASSTRAMRSRYSSPAQPPSGGVNGSAETTPPGKGSTGKPGSSRGFMERWLEPPVQHKSSFEEHGFARYGVVENMAPLGSLPKVRKPVAEPEKPRRKIILKSSSHLASRPSLPESHTTDERRTEETANKNSAPAPAPLVSNPLSPSKLSPPKSLPPPTRKSLPSGKSLPMADDTASDEDYNPSGRGRRRSAHASSTLRKSQRSSTGQRAALPSAKPGATSAASQTGGEDIPTSTLVSNAARSAMDHARWPTAYALQILYDESLENKEYLALFKAIAFQLADEEQMQRFSALIEKKKRQAVKNYPDNGRMYFMPEEPGQVRQTLEPPRAAPFHALLKPRVRRFISNLKGNTPAAVDDDETEDESPPAESERPAKRRKTSPLQDATPRKTQASGTVGQRASRLKTPRSRKRARSGGSESSLSSAQTVTLSPEKARVHADSPDQSPSAHRSRQATGDFSRDGILAGDGAGPRGARARSKPRAGRGRSIAPNPQPITTRGKSKPAASASRSGSPSTQRPRRTSPPNNSSSGIDDTMPGRVETPELSLIPGKKTFKDGKKVKGTPVAEEERVFTREDEEVIKRKQEGVKVTNGYHAIDSSIRSTREPDVESEQEPRASTLGTPARRTRQAARQSDLPTASVRATRSVNGKRVADDVDSVADLSFAGETSSVAGSRAVTPSSSRQGKKPRTGLRVKSSPVKKKSGTAAGVPRPMGEAQSASDQGAPKDHISDNDEYCSACGSDGEVLCCDGCRRSFHFECLDIPPPRDDTEDWFCNDCIGKKFPSRLGVHSGVFGSALSILDRTNSRSFALPKKLQTRFEGVRAGPEGEYEDVVATKPPSKRKAEEIPDLYKQRDDGRAVLCHACQGPASLEKPILQCSACPFHWHLDCLDPPLVNPSRTWRCPAHIEDIQTEAHKLAPAHRHRKLKHNNIIKPALSRGLRNNGYIDIDWTHEPEEPENMSGWTDPDSFGRFYSVEPKSIVLDFITQLRGAGAGYGPSSQNLRRTPLLSPPVEDPATPVRGLDMHRTADDYLASQILATLKQQEDAKAAQDLLHKKNSRPVSRVVQANTAILAADNLDLGNEGDMRTLLSQMDILSARIRQRLGDDDHSPAGSAAAPQGTTPVSDSMGVEEPIAAGKVEPVLPVTEPTPPSTVDQAEGSMDLD